MKRLSIALALVIILLGTACAKAPAPSVSKDESSGITILPRPTPVPTPVPALAPPVTIVLPSEEAGQSEVADRMIIRTGNLSLVVNDVTASVDQITRLTDNFKGYVVSARSWREGERLVGSITVRVPATQFADAMRAIRALAVEVTSETTSSKDVTEEYVDLTAKLRNLEAAETQLLRIMEKATKVDEILAVQRELTNVRGEIEQTKGRMQYLERSSETSLIEVRLEQAKLEVKFTANKVRVKKGEEVSFSGQIAGGFTPYSYEWDFGDKTTSSDSYPRHAYKASGTYTVSLRVTDDRGNTDTETRKEYITVLPGWSAGSVASSAWNGLITFGQVLGTIAIWVGYFSPVWIIVGVIVYFGYFRRKRRKA